MLLLGGCSSVMSHTGGKEGTYPGTRASATMIGNDETNWGHQIVGHPGYAIYRRDGYDPSAVGHLPQRQFR
ncbi:putative lipoprotein [Salmonella enterica subsp. enterica]|uniref:Putative lipoprotein n=1 Tax=Salmonella enterica I TaxID=59201 RepID=A0A3S4LSM1_SALET|nr:putative lipoprotein [Salmonella enterica subsp. enterica]